MRIFTRFFYLYSKFWNLVKVYQHKIDYQHKKTLIMKTFAKTVVFTILLLAIPMKHFGQTLKSDIIKIELSAINNPDFRYCLLSYVAHDENISYVINEEESSVLLSSQPTISRLL